MTVSLDRIVVLHVDDDPDFASMAASYLEREDDRFEVETVTSVDEAFERLPGEFDCIVSDYDMPGRNGIEFLDAVHGRNLDLPFILYTGKGSEEVASEAISAGVTDYLQKEQGTGQYTVLANRIRNAVRQARSQHKLEASQERLSLFIEQSPLGVLEYDEEFEIVGLNPAGEEILGYSTADLRGETWEKLVTESSYDDVDEVTSALAEARGGYHSIDENVRKDGERIIVEWHNRVVTDDDGEVVAVFSQFQDVTDREERKERLERTTARLEALFENSPDMINVHDAEGNIIDPNARLVEATGYSREELESMKVWELDRTIDRETAMNFWDGMDVGDRHRLEGEYERRDGSTLPVEVNVARLNLDGDDRFVVSSRDISQRVASERELERTNTLLSTLFETLPVGVLAEDESRNVLAVNRRMFDLFDISGTPESLVGTDCEQLAEDASEQFVDSEAFLARTNDLVRTDETVHGEEWTLRDGRTFARSHKTIDLRSGAGHLWVYRTITGQKAHERRLQALNETSQELMAAESREAVAELAVGAAAELLAPDADALYLFDEESGLVPAASVADREDLPTITDGGRVAWHVHESGDVVVRDGVDGDPDTFGAPVRSELYLPVGSAGVLVSGSTAADAFDRQDVTVGEILSSTVATALDQVDRTERLRARRRELARQNDRLEEFTSVVSHDLRNPLNVARGQFELATEGIDGEHVAAVERAHERMGALIDDLLTLAREGNRVGDVEPVDLAGVARNCWRTVDVGDATLRVETASAVYADRSRLQQLLENLLRNSVEHGSPDDGAERGGVTVTVGELDDGFYVADDGPGIPETEREDVFDAGYSTSMEGTGFGLSIVREVADAHDWTVRAVESADGGARFEIRGVERADTASP